MGPVKIIMYSYLFFNINELYFLKKQKYKVVNNNKKN
jgi:hypothetical protein